MHGEYMLSNEQSPLASNDLLCLHLRFDDVWFRALYKCDHLVTFSLRGLQRAYCRRGTSKGARAELGHCQNLKSACAIGRLMAHLKYERDAEKGLEQPGR